MLDDILALQFAVGWAGEGRPDPKRLGWWDTDLIDEAGGGDFFLRLTPRTHAWAALDAVREAARRIDEKGRKKMAEPDLVRTLFFLGFELDEQLGDRLLAHKRAGRTPADVLTFPFKLDRFDKAAVAQALTAQGPEPFTVVPGGRQLRGTAPSDALVLVKRLAAGLVPFTDAYPAPFFKVATP